MRALLIGVILSMAAATAPPPIEYATAGVPQFTVRPIPEGTHWVVHEKPVEVNRNIRDFLAR